MGTVTCDCGVPVSSKASKCPKCGSPLGKAKTKAEKKFNCKTCGATLLQNKHIEGSIRGSTMINGSSTATYYENINPCTECGEPNPFSFFTMMKIKPILSIIQVIIVIAIIAFVCHLIGTVRIISWNCKMTRPCVWIWVFNTSSNNKDLEYYSPVAGDLYGPKPFQFSL